MEKLGRLRRLYFRDGLALSEIARKTGFARNTVQGWLEAEKLATLLIMQVHDELVLQVPEGELDSVKGALPGLMQDVAKLDVQLIVDVGVGDNWDEAH